MTRYPVIVLLLLVTSQQISAQKNTFPYRLRKSDYVILPVAAATELTAILLENNRRHLTGNDIIALNKNDINKFDRSATDNWSPSLERASDIEISVILASPVVLIIDQMKSKSWSNAAIYSIMYLESLSVTYGINNLTKSLVHRERPYLYNPGVSVDAKEKLDRKNNSFASFYSGHTAGAFSTAVFISKTYSDIYGKTTMSRVIWGISLSAAASVGYFRYKSGQHFPYGRHCWVPYWGVHPDT